MKKIYDRNMTSLTGGNLSVMDSEGVMWVTPSGIDKGKLRPEDIVKVFPDGSWEGIHKPTSEYRVHKQIYECRPELRAVLHAHCPAMVALSITHENVRSDLMLASKEICGSSAVAAYETPGSKFLAEVIAAKFAEGYDVAVMENHAVFVASQEGLRAGYAALEQLERTAMLQLLSAGFGKTERLSEEQYRAYRSVYGKTGQKKIDVVKEKNISEQEETIRGKLADFSRRAYRKGLFSEETGVFSVKLNEHAFLISAENKNHEKASADNFVRIERIKRTDGTELFHAIGEKQELPDCNWKLHAQVYEKNPEISCIMQASPTVLSTYAVSDPVGS